MLVLLWAAMFPLILYGIFSSRPEPGGSVKGCFKPMGLFKSIFGDYSSRELKSIYPIVDKIEALSDE